MKVRQVMTEQVIRISPEETVAVAARMLTHYNIGAMPVMGSNGHMCGMITDRDIVSRCLAAGRSAENTKVREVMTSKVIVVRPDTEANLAAGIMGREQVRRLPVMENGKLCGMISLADLAVREDTGIDAAEALTEISSGLSRREW